MGVAEAPAAIVGVSVGDDVDVGLETSVGEPVGRTVGVGVLVLVGVTETPGVGPGPLPVASASK